jgi:DNA polymerase III sliding clamp (beta) subunit (PCNA family)
MKLKMESDSLQQALALHSRITASPHVSIRAEGDTVHVISTHKGRVLHRRISDIEVLDEGEFTADPVHLAGVLSRRKNVTLHYNEERVEVKGGKYSAQVTVLPYEDIEVVPPEGTDLGFESEEVEVLTRLCNHAQLTSPTLDGGNLPLVVRLDDKGVQVACIDNYHVSLVQSRELSRDTAIDLILPSGVLDTLKTAASDATYRVVLAANQIYAEGESFSFSSPTEQVSSTKNLGHVAALRKSIKSSKEVTQIETTVEELNTVLENVFAVAEQSVPIVLSTKTTKKGTSFSMATHSSFGSVTGEVDAEVEGEDVEAKFVADLLSEVLRKIKSDKVSLNILPNLLHISEVHGAVRSLLVLIRS